ncbi:hypothetical protein F4694_005729 [Bacillus niacini]|jgi:hypothetical protein|uniref:Uncharacterized protein n=1 Tax=Neobacillus niacini TaxID=86668 RepID=A0A852TJA3_9BACI|nr:hypothetical protein [Neobacillus niacini]
MLPIKLISTNDMSNKYSQNMIDYLPFKGWPTTVSPNFFSFSAIRSRGTDKSVKGARLVENRYRKLQKVEEKGTICGESLL